jgi:hypothetical protein
MARTGFPARSRGFSLLEAIVTLVIVALIVTLLMQALAQSLDLRERLLRHQRLATVASLQEQWFRETVSSSMADLGDGLGRMAGTGDTLELVTSVPLGDGGLQRVKWWLQPVPGGLALHYADSTWDDLVVVAGPLQDASFAYLDGGLEWSGRWEPEAEATDILPRMVRLQASTATGELQWLVPIAAHPRVPGYLRPQDAASGL